MYVSLLLSEEDSLNECSKIVVQAVRVDLRQDVVFYVRMGIYTTILVILMTVHCTLALAKHEYSTKQDH